VIDITVEGVSLLLTTRRSEFSAIANQGVIIAVIQKLNKMSSKVAA